MNIDLIVDDIVERAKLLGNKVSLIVGIAGASGSGKTALSLELKDKIYTISDRRITPGIINGDNYYRSNYSREDYCRYFDSVYMKRRLAGDLSRYKCRNSIRMPSHDMILRKTKLHEIYVPSRKIGIVEGLFTLTESIRKEIDIGIFIESSSDIRKLTIDRDINERGISVENAMKYNYLKESLYRSVVAPTVNGANYVIDSEVIR